MNEMFLLREHFFFFLNFHVLKSAMTEELCKPKRNKQDTLANRKTKT